MFRWGVVAMGVVGLLLTIALGSWLCEKHIPQMLLAKYKAQSPMANSDMAFFRFGTRFDGDGDGLTDAEEEFVYGTSPVRADTDFDGLTDYDECRYYATDPRNPDSDGDGVRDGNKRYHGSDPLLADSDTDGLTDAEEARYCHSYRLPLWLEGDGQTEVLNAPSVIV